MRADTREIHRTLRALLMQRAEHMQRIRDINVAVECIRALPARTPQKEVRDGE